MKKQELLKKLSEGKEFKYLGFAVGVLSNWAPCEIKDNEHATYDSSEQFFMAQKAVFFGDDDTLLKIMTSKDVSRIKELGREVKGFDEQAWMVVSDDFMFEANLLKFSQNANLRKTLMATGDDVLVECNPADLIWGAGIDMMDKRVHEPFEWPGQNKFGFTLMKVRDELNKPMHAI